MYICNVFHSNVIKRKWQGTLPFNNKTRLTCTKAKGELMSSCPFYWIEFQWEAVWQKLNPHSIKSRSLLFSWSKKRIRLKLVILNLQRALPTKQSPQTGLAKQSIMVNEACWEYSSILGGTVLYATFFFFLLSDLEKTKFKFLVLNFHNILLGKKCKHIKHLCNNDNFENKITNE